MSKTVAVTSKQQLDSLLSSSKIVIIDFWAPWCGPCKAMNPAYEELSSHLSRPQKVTFTKVNIDEQQEIARLYSVNSIPTFKIFKNAQNVETIVGADRSKLSNAVKKIAVEADGDGLDGGYGETSAKSWLGASLARGYKDVTDQVDVRGLELLNADTAFGSARDLFDSKQPASLTKSDKKDWVESDTDEQLMLFVPFQSTLKVHTLLLTSIAPQEEEAEAEAAMRPKTIRLYKNRAHTLGFDEADDIEPTQIIELQSGDWDEKTGTAKIELRFVKFQNVTSLVVFVVDGDGDGERTRLDRIRVIGESGEKRDIGKLEKVGDGAD